MNRRHFLRTLSAASASGILMPAQAEVLLHQLRAPHSVVIPGVTLIYRQAARPSPHKTYLNGKVLQEMVPPAVFRVDVTMGQWLDMNVRMKALESNEAAVRAGLHAKLAQAKRSRHGRTVRQYLQEQLALDRPANAGVTVYESKVRW